MDNTVYNGYKCGLCSQRLASKYSLERHIRLKHKSDLDGNTIALESEPPAKKSMMAKYVPYVEKEEESEDGDGESNNNDSDTDLDNNNHMDSEKDDESIENEDNIDKESDNTEGDVELGGESEESVTCMDMETSNNVNEYKHDLFDIVDTSKEMCDRFKPCGVVVTFRIKPPPVHISRPRLYGKWMDDLFGGILEYLAPKYSLEPEDFVSFDFFHADTNTTQWMWPLKRKELNVAHIVSALLGGNIANPSGHLTIALNCLKAEITCPTCGHTRVNKDGMSYTD